MTRRYRKKRGCISSVVRIVIFFWAISFFSGLIKEIGGRVLPSKYSHTVYIETPETLKTIEPYGNEAFPGSFVRASQEWDYGRRSWESTWHVSRTELKAAARELDAFAEHNPVPLKEGMSQEAYSVAFFTELYRNAAEKNRRRLNNIVYGLDWLRKENNLDDREFVELVIRLIQEIPYEIPEEKRYGLSSPEEVISENRGDCDSKSVLAAVLFKRFGIDSVILLSPYYEHAMLGLGYPGLGDYKQYRSRPYYFVEMTRPGWRIGQLPDEVGNAEKWFVVPLE